jgi:hypothetical protein
MALLYESYGWFLAVDCPKDAAQYRQNALHPLNHHLRPFVQTIKGRKGKKGLDPGIYGQFAPN